MNKRCRTCQILKLTSEFYKSKACADGVVKDCIACVKTKAHCNHQNNKERNSMVGKRWYGNNKARVAITCARYARNNPDKMKANSERWRINNPDKIRAVRAKYAKNNPEKLAARGAKRRAAKLLRTPIWADHNAIQVFYSAAKAMDFFNPCSKHEVDHVIPLQGRKVSGLHVENNFQILTQRENAAKHNRYAPYFNYQNLIYIKEPTKSLL